MLLKAEHAIPFQRTRSGFPRPLIAVEPWTEAKREPSATHRRFWLLDTGADCTVLNSASGDGAYSPEVFGLDVDRPDETRPVGRLHAEGEMASVDLPFYRMTLHFPDLRSDDRYPAIATLVGWAPLAPDVPGIIGNDALIGHGVTITIRTEAGQPVMEFALPEELLIDP